MTKNVVFGYVDDSLLEIKRKLSVNNISHIPIVSRERNAVIGMVTWNGIYRAHQEFSSKRLS